MRPARSKRSLRCGATRDALVRSTQAVFYLVDLLQDVNEAVRGTADAALDAVMDADEELAVQIRRLKFGAQRQVVETPSIATSGWTGRSRARATKPRRAGLAAAGGIITTRRAYSDGEDDSPTLGVRAPGFVYDDPARFYEEGARDERGGEYGGEYY